MRMPLNGTRLLAQITLILSAWVDMAAQEPVDLEAVTELLELDRSIVEVTAASGWVGDSLNHHDGEDSLAARGTSPASLFWAPSYSFPQVAKENG